MPNAVFQDGTFVPSADVPNSWDEEVEDELHENLVSGHQIMPTMRALAQEAEDIDAALKAEEQTDLLTDDQLQDLIDDQKTPTFSRPSVSFKSLPKQKEQKQSPPTEPASSNSALELEYQESFTSQEETAQIRHHIESLDSRMKVMEEMISSVLAERKNLPKHLDTYRSEMNKQLTVMADRLHTALEKNLDRSVMQQSSNDIEVLGRETDHVLTQLRNDLEAEPIQTSATANAVPITKTKRRVRVIE